MAHYLFIDSIARKAGLHKGEEIVTHYLIFDYAIFEAAFGRMLPIHLLL